ncbi:predicted protein [Chaetoceros tenuissimus]|uniref:MYND-type domain-containing protein n=1 Tax=Chaetoceros tenuissimus TaxID=426638 RepID=A0AAD3GZ86_9STRA|nr:predicted protein [Chaetoceros tenuissimus]
MGKKSKRRTGKTRQQKAVAANNASQDDQVEQQIEDMTLENTSNASSQNNFVSSDMKQDDYYELSIENLQKEEDKNIQKFVPKSNIDTQVANAVPQRQPIPTGPHQQGIERKIRLTTEGRNDLTQAVLSSLRDPQGSSLRDPQGKMDPALLQKAKQSTGLKEKAILKAATMAREKELAKRQEAARKSATENPNRADSNLTAAVAPSSAVASTSQSQDESKTKSRVAKRQLQIDAILSTDEEKEAFEEFMIWSLSDEAEMNPKKFAKHASGIAKLFIAGEISIRKLLNKRRATLTKMEMKTKEYEYQECFQFLFSEMNFGSPEYEDDFRQQIYQTLIKRDRIEHSETPMYMVLYDSFQEVLSKWSNASKVCLDDDCIFAGASREEFDKLFSHILQEKIKYQVDSGNKTGMMKDKLFQKYYLHPFARGEEYLGKGRVYANNILNSVLRLYEESHRCWRCNQLHGQGNETKALICARCKCAVYCSKECQEKHWKKGEEFSHSHKKCCEGGLDERWSVYKSNTKRVERALRKGRIFTKPLIVNETEKECFLRPYESFDYFLCKPSSLHALCESMETFYKNIATLACGGKHLLFGDETISSQLEEKIRICYEDVIFEFDPGTLKEEEISDMERTAEMLRLEESYWTKYHTLWYEESYWTKYHTKRSSLSVERFITLYICLGFHPGKKRGNLDKFKIETNFVQALRYRHW